MDLTQLVDTAPELEERIGGVRVFFSEIPIEAMAGLQAWIKERVPHPLEAIRDHLAHLPPAIAAELAERARQEAKSWPPEVGTEDGARVLTGTPDGQAECFYEGLKVHHPDVTRDDASRLYRQLRREVSKSRDGRRVLRIFATIFGTDPPDERQDMPVLKNGQPLVAASIGG